MNRKLRKPTVVLLAGAVGMASLTMEGGCQTSEGTSAAAGILTGAATTMIASGAGMDTEEALALGAGVGLAVSGITYMVLEHENRQATTREQQIAQEQAKQRMHELTAVEENVIKQEEDAKLAVQVGEDAYSRHVVLIDPNTKEPADDQVYYIPKSEFEKMPTAADLPQQHAGANNESDYSTEPFRRTQTDARSQLNTKPIKVADASSEERSSTTSTSAPVEPADPKTIKFGKIGNTPVIFRTS